MTDHDAVGVTGLGEATGLPDLAFSGLGGSVVFATDDLFAEKENLIKEGPPVFTAGQFGNRGKIYDGWETRRHRAPGHDYAIIRLGIPGIVRGVVVDTSFFRGNYPPQVSVESLGAEGYPSPDELTAMPWQTLVERTDALGDAVNSYPVASPVRWTHVRLSIYPDGGVARFRVHGTPLPDPRFLTGTIDLAALENGGRVVGCSDAFYSAAGHLILPGRAAGMAQGWENARRRGPGHDYVIVALAAPGVLRHVEIDTSCFVGNAPEQVRLLAADARDAPGSASGDDPGPASADEPGSATRDLPIAESAWREVLPLTRVQPDTRHRFVVEDHAAATHVRLDVIPDGGLARLRINGEILPPALADLRQRWLDALPRPQRQAVVAGGPAAR
jgi:allantoicase